VDAGRRDREVAQGARDARGERVGQVADAQAHGRLVAGGARRVLGHLRVAQDMPRLLEQGGAGGRERDAALGTVEEPDPELLLELAYLFADGRLRDVQAFRRLAEMQLLATATKYLRWRSSIAALPTGTNQHPA
jgi:hypothetical protein